MDLNGKVYSMVTKLREKPEDESLLDECLILPSLVSIWVFIFFMQVLEAKSNWI